MIEKVASYLKGRVDSFEIFYEDFDVLSVTMEGKHPDIVSEGITKGIGVRVEMKKKIGMASTLNLNGYKECCDIALKFAKLNNPDKNFIKFQDKQSYKKILSHDKSLLAFGFEDTKRYLKELVENIEQVNKGLKVSLTNYSKNVANTRIVNSEGVDAERISAVNRRFYEILLDKTSLSFSDESLVPLNAEKARDEAQRVLLMKNAQPVKTGEVQVLMHPEALAALCAESLDFSLDAENVYLKKSLLHNKLGEEVYNKKITFIDDATKQGCINTRAFDDEGTASQVTSLVEKGVLKSFLYDSYYAFLQKKKSTGNAIRGISSSPSIAPSNIFMSPGTKTRSALLSSIDKGIFVKGMMGLHTMDAATGDFSLTVSEGQYVEKGQIKYGLKETMIAGNFFELLKNVEEVSREVEYAGYGFYLPYLLGKVRVISH